MKSKPPQIVMMGWYFKTSVEEGIKAARIFYQKKYGRFPEVVLVNVNQIPSAEIKGISVRPWRYVLPNNLMLYEEVENTNKQLMQ